MDTILLAMTYDSHDYPFLLEKAWGKIQRESGLPIETLPSHYQEIIANKISRMLTEEYHHAVPIEGMNGVDRCFGVMFTEENGVYGITPIMGFGGNMSLLTYADVFTAPKVTSNYDGEISGRL